MAELPAFPRPLRPSREVGQVARALLALIAAGGPQTVSSLTDRLKASPQVVDLALQVLIVGGRIEEVVSPAECTLTAGSTQHQVCVSCGLATSCASAATPTGVGLRSLRMASRDR